MPTVKTILTRYFLQLIKKSVKYAPHMRRIYDSVNAT